MTQVLDSIDEFASLLSGLGHLVAEADYTTEFTNALPLLAQQEAEMFAGGFDSSHDAWSPLKQSTIKRDGHDQELIETSTLRASLIGVDGPGNIAEAGPRGMLFGTDVAYAIFLQDGTSRMPARPVVGMSTTTLDKLVNAIADATVQTMKLTP